MLNFGCLCGFCCFGVCDMVECGVDWYFDVCCVIFV